MTKIIANLKTLAITKVNTEVLQITYVSSKVVYLKKFLCFFFNELDYDNHFFIIKN